jgi:hypothetical protein
MNAIDVLVKNVEESLNWLKWTIADISDVELMTRPCEGANHANWQLGHLVVGCNHMMAPAGGKAIELPAGFAEKYSKEAASSNDAAKFAKKDELIALLDKVHAAAVAGIKSLKEADLSKPGPESMKDYAPTIGAVALLLGQHLQMHMGQFQVIRRKLGKPVLF